MQIAEDHVRGYGRGGYGHGGYGHSGYGGYGYAGYPVPAAAYGTTFMCCFIASYMYGILWNNKRCVGPPTRRA